jgi:hypothetical protein
MRSAAHNISDICEFVVLNTTRVILWSACQRFAADIFSIMILYDEVEACYEPYRSHLVSYVSVLHSTATGLVQLLLGP